MLVLTNDDVQALVSIPDCVNALEQAYRDFGNGEAVDVPRQDMLGANGRVGAVHAFKTMSGSWPQGGVTALRLVSDILAWPLVDGKPRRHKLALAEPGGRYNGSVLLFSVETGQLLCILNDGVIQKTRVGCTSAVAARYLARDESTTMGLLGTGQQAEAHLEAMFAVRRLALVKVFSPNAEHRRSFAARFREKLQIEVRAVDEPETAAAGVDILLSATNAAQATIKADWLTPGMHISSVNGKEISAAVLAKVDRLVIHTKEPLTVRAGRGWPSQVPEFTSGEYSPDARDKIDDVATPELREVVAGQVAGRRTAADITCFYNSKGLGLQFAAVGIVVYREAMKRGVGRVLDDALFTQTVHS